MRILHVDDMFHPNYGYHVNPLAKFQSKMGHEVFVISPEADCLFGVYKGFGETGEHLAEDDAAYEKETGVKIVHVKGKGYIFRRLNYEKKDFYKKIEEINPDVIMLHQMETISAMRGMHKYKNKYPIVLDSHMLTMASKNKLAKLYEMVYRMTFTALVKKKRYMVILTQDDDYVIDKLGVPKELTKFISFGTDTMLFHPDEEVKKKFKKDNGLADDTFVIVSTGKLIPDKNGKLFGEAMLPRFKNRPVAVVVVANFKSDYEMSVKANLERSENKVFFYPPQKYIDLPFFYQISDVTVFPKQCSMSFYDAQACGSPVISEKGHVNEERNSHGNGLNFECGSVVDFRDKIQQMIDMPEEEYHNMRESSIRFVTENYGYENIAAQYTEELENAYNEFHRKK